MDSSYYWVKGATGKNKVFLYVIPQKDDIIGKQPHTKQKNDSPRQLVNVMTFK